MRARTKFTMPETKRFSGSREQVPEELAEHSGKASWKRSYFLFEKRKTAEMRGFQGHGKESLAFACSVLWGGQLGKGEELRRGWGGKEGREGWTYHDAHTMARAGMAGKLAGKSAPAVVGKHFLSLCQGASLIIIYPPQAAQRPAKEQRDAGARAQPGGQESWTVVCTSLATCREPWPSHLISSLGMLEGGGSGKSAALGPRPAQGFRFSG